MIPNKLSVVLLVSVLLVGCSLSGYAQPADSLARSFTRYIAQLDSAVNHANKQLLLQAKDGFQKLTDHGEHRVLATYYLGYADYRLSSIFENMGDDQKEQYLNAAIERLGEVTEMAPNFAEGWALLGNCYGMKATGVFSGIRYGPKSVNAINRAVELAPGNPRVLMINGISLLYKPSIFGGSLEKAITELKEAAVQFKNWQPESPFDPDWGTAENYAWLAQGYIQQDKLQQAQQAYQSALQIKSDYYWVKDVLLPELKQQMD